MLRPFSLLITYGHSAVIRHASGPLTGLPWSPGFPGFPLGPVTPGDPGLPYNIQVGKGGVMMKKNHI